MKYIKANAMKVTNKTEIERVLKWIDRCVNEYQENRKAIKKKEL